MVLEGNEKQAYVVTAGVTPNEMTTGSRLRSVQKKHVIIAVAVLVGIGLVVGAIIGGIYIFAEEQKALVQFTLQFKSASDNQLTNQSVVSDPNDNVVEYHVTKPGQDVYVINDFNKDLQIVRIQTSTETNCYVAPLNRTSAMDPSTIAGPSNENGAASDQTFTLSSTPVTDRSFLTKKAADRCQGVSLYWAYRGCGAQNINAGQNTTAGGDRGKRSIYLMSPVYGMYGLGGCCKAYWACKVQMVETIVGSTHYCNTYLTTGTCCGPIAYPYCNNWYYSYWQTPGLYC